MDLKAPTFLLKLKPNYTNIYIHRSLHTHIYINTYIHTYMHRHTHTHTHKQTNKHLCTNKRYPFISCSSLCTCTHTHAHSHLTHTHSGTLRLYYSGKISMMERYDRVEIAVSCKNTGLFVMQQSQFKSFLNSHKIYSNWQNVTWRNFVAVKLSKKVCIYN